MVDSPYEKPPVPHPKTPMQRVLSKSASVCWRGSMLEQADSVSSKSFRQAAVTGAEAAVQVADFTSDKKENNN